MRKTYNDLYKNFNKKFIVTALGVAALGIQLIQSNTAKADTTSDSTGAATEQASDVKKNDAAVADSSSIKNDTNNDASDNNTSNEATNNDNGTNSEQNSSDTDTSKSGVVAASADVSDSNSNDTATGTGSDSSTDTDKKDNTDATNNSSDVDANKDQTQDTQTAADATTNSDPALVDGTPAGSEPKVDTTGDPIQTNVAISATNSTGTMTSTSTATKNASVLVNTDATSVNEVVTITNTSDEKQGDYGAIIRLPKFYQDLEGTKNRISNIVLSDGFESTDFIKGLPSGADIVYSTSTQNNWQTEESLKSDSNFKWSDVDSIQINSGIFHFNNTTGYLDPGQSIVATIPLTTKTADEYTLQGVSKVGVDYSRANDKYRKNGDSLSYRYSTVVETPSSWNGTYRATTVVKLGEVYDPAPADAQNLMPEYKPGDIDVDNFFGYDTVDGTDSVLTKGGIAYVHLNNLGIKDQLNDNGYSFLLNSDGSQQSEYSYQMTKDGVTLNAGDGSGTAGKAVPEVYITVRHVIDASDSTTKVGDTWTAASNLNSVQDNSDATLTGDDAANAVSTTITDNDGVLKDGKVVKAGTFNVTYTYLLKDGTPITKTVTVTADPATNNNSGSASNNSGSSHHSSGTSTNTSDPVISPNTPDDINDVDRLVSTHPNNGTVTLYTLDTSTVQNRGLKAATDWFSDKEMSFGGDTYYRVATNEWVKASSVYVYEDRNIVVQTNDVQQLVDSQGNVVSNRALLADTAWRSDRIAYINGKTYYRVATNEFVPTDAVTVL